MSWSAPIKSRFAPNAASRFVRAVGEAVDVPDHERVLAQVRDPDGRMAVLLERIWVGKTAADHPELAGYREAVLATVSAPDHVEPDPRADRRRYYRRRVGASRWLLVVVSYEQRPGRMVTALATRKDPKRWQPST